MDYKVIESQRYMSKWLALIEMENGKFYLQEYHDEICSRPTWDMPACDIDNPYEGVRVLRAVAEWGNNIEASLKRKA